MGAVMHSPSSIGALGNRGVGAALKMLESNIRRIFLFRELLVWGRGATTTAHLAFSSELCRRTAGAVPQPRGDENHLPYAEGLLHKTRMVGGEPRHKVSK